MGRIHLIKNIRIFDSGFNVRTNSLFLKTLLEKLPFYFNKRSNKRPADVHFILKKPGNIEENLSCITRLGYDAIEDIKDKLWVFHGVSFSKNGKAVLVMGDAASGKSSLCLAAGLSGAKIISEEPILIDRKSLHVLPFRYLLKIVDFYDNFSKWGFFPKTADCRGALFTENNLSIGLFAKEDLGRLDIAVEDKRRPLKKIIFLEEKKYNPLIHLANHSVYKKDRLWERLSSFKKFVDQERVLFITDISGKLRHEKKIRKLIEDMLGD